MYWNPHSHSSMESLLDKHDTKLETLLSIDNILLQVKNGDKKLISFLAQPDHLMKLFSYAVATNLPEDKAIKYPYVACEIICADHGRFIETMRRNTNIISPLWSFLRELKPRHMMSSKINNSVTGDSPSAVQNGAIFFSRLNIFLFNKMLPVMLNFLNERVPNAVKLLVNNLDLQPISELLYRFYGLYNGENEILEWLRKGNFYENLADQLAPSKGSDLHFAVSQFVKGLFSLPFPDSFPRDQIIKPFLSPNFFNRLLENVFRSEDAENSDFDREEIEQSSIINGLEVISSILKASRQYEDDFLGDDFVSCLLGHFETFFDILKRGNCGELQLTAGNVEIFGRIRLGIVEMIVELFSCLPESRKCLEYVKVFWTCQLFPVLLDSFFHYKQNNLLHDLIVKLIKELFEESEHFELIIDQILKDYRLRDRIVQAQRENDVQVQRPRGNRLAFMGHLTLIAESIIKWENDLGKKPTTTSSFVVSCVPEESWREYSNKSFKETRLKDKKVLGGIKPPVSIAEMLSSSEDEGSGDEVLNYNSIFRSGNEEQLARYFCQQLIGNFPDQFLYADDQSSGSESESDDDDDMEIVFESEKGRRKKRNGAGGVVQSIEIPILMSHDDFDEEMMFDDSFTSSLLSDSDEDDDESEFDDDYEM